MNWLIAHLGGYFWIHCRRCGKGFGGHQWGGRYLDAMSLAAGPGRATCTYCPACAKSRDNWEPGWLQVQQIEMGLAQYFNRFGPA